MKSLDEKLRLACAWLFLGWFLVPTALLGGFVVWYCKVWLCKVGRGKVWWAMGETPWPFLFVISLI